MKPTIKYNTEFDFLFYTETCANAKDLKKISDAESKAQPIVKNKHLKKMSDQFFKDAEIYHDDILSYIQRNEIDMFFKKVSIFFDYLMHLAYENIDLENESSDDFKTYLLKELEIEPSDLEVKKLRLAIKNNYQSPNSFEDYDKATELVLEILNDERMFNLNFKNAVSSLRDLFIKEKYLPNKEDIDCKLIEHNDVFEKDPQEFLNKISFGLIKSRDLNVADFQTYISYFGLFRLMISVNNNLIIYSSNLDKITETDVEKDMIHPLLKFLSDPKRYEMIQVLSKGKWYANELAKKFKITPATMSYHLNKLYTLGLISFEQGEQNKLYIELDNSRLEYLLDEIKKDFVK